jgi:nicotinamidase-related amidase
MNVFSQWTNNDVLLVLDMQKDFKAAHNIYLLKYITDEIKRAQARGDLIILMGYTLTGSARHVSHISCIEKLVNNYDAKLKLIKMEDSGLNALEEAFNKYNVNTIAHIRLVGVNTDACIAKTALDLHEHMNVKKIYILKNGCASSNASRHEETLLQFELMNSFKLSVL